MEFIIISLVATKYKKCRCRLYRQKNDKYIDTCLYRWRFMHVDIYSGADTRYEMA